MIFIHQHGKKSKTSFSGNRRKKPKSVNDIEDMDGDSTQPIETVESTEDPNKLYCYCQQHYDYFKFYIQVIVT